MPKFLKGKKRLYMTATPRIYGDDAKSKAKEATAELARWTIPRSSARNCTASVSAKRSSKSLLADYKVLVLAVDEKYVSKTFQKQIADKNSELNLDDAAKITGCWNGLEKQFESRRRSRRRPAGRRPTHAPGRRLLPLHQGLQGIRRAVRGRSSTRTRNRTPTPTDLLEFEADHVDGTFDALRRERTARLAQGRVARQHLPHPLQRPLSVRRRGRARARRRAVPQPAQQRDRRRPVRRPRDAPGRRASATATSSCPSASPPTPRPKRR